MIFATLRLPIVLFCRAMGSILFYLFKRRKNVAVSNVSRCFPAVNPIRVARRSYANQGQTLADFLLLKWYTKKNIDRYVSFRNMHYINNALAQGRGVIVSTGHFGSWELAAHALALYGFKSSIVYNKLKKPVWLDGLVKKNRERSGNKLILKERAFIALYKALKKGEAVTIVTDQHAYPPEGDKMCFLGQEAWVHSAFVKLSIKTGAVIVPAFMFTEGYSKYVIKAFSPIDPFDYANAADRVVTMTKRAHQALEGVIEREPTLWLWQHRRFKEL